MQRLFKTSALIQRAFNQQQITKRQLTKYYVINGGTPEQREDKFAQLAHNNNKLYCLKMQDLDHEKTAAIFTDKPAKVTDQKNWPSLNCVERKANERVHKNLGRDFSGEPGSADRGVINLDNEEGTEFKPRCR